MTAAERKAKATARKEAQARIESACAEARRVVATGKCPCCGSPLRRNLAMTGWWQCSQYGADGWRADNSKPACNWQGFTE